MALTVNGVAIAEERVAEEMGRMREAYVAYVAGNGGESSEVQLREWAEENLIEAEVMRQRAVATQPEPSEARARQWVASNEAYYAAFPEGEREARAKDDLRVRRLEKEVRQRVPRAADDAVRREYEAHPASYTLPETLRLSHICRLIGPGGCSRATGFLELLRIKADLDAGRTNWFAVMEASDTYGEDHGAFKTVMRGQLPDDVEAQLFALKPGQVSDVIDLGGSSLHLFRLLAVDAPALAPLDAVREHIRESLFEQACQTALEQMLDALKAAATIAREA